MKDDEEAVQKIKTLENLNQSYRDKVISLNEEIGKFKDQVALIQEKAQKVKQS